MSSISKNGFPEINDIRNENEFRGITFSKYKLSDVTKALLKSMTNSRIEPACNWSAELICAGKFIELWESILVFMGKYVHLANPRLPTYVYLRYENFKTIASNGYIGNELRMRNNPKIRSLFAEIISVLCYSNKLHQYENIKISKTEEYDVTAMSEKLKAPHVKYLDDIFIKGDPPELFIALNEFAFHLSNEPGSSSHFACYWLEWIMEFNNICKTKKVQCKCERRANVPVDDKLQMDPIWIVWQIVITESKKNVALSDTHTAGGTAARTLSAKIINCLFKLYCIRFTVAVKKKRRYLLYFAVSLLTQPYSVRQDIILTDYKEKISNVVQKIDAVYREIKKNEISPKMDYLFNGSARSDLDKTIAKLDILNAYHSATSAASAASTGPTFSNGVESDDNDESFRLNE
jgi:hypothetical protein